MKMSDTQGEGLNRQDLLQVGILAAAAVLLLCGIVLAFLDKAATAAATYGVAVLVLIFAFLAKFKKFEGLGIKAELWESKQQEAAELIDNLKTLSAAVAGPVMAMAVRVGHPKRHFTTQQRREPIAGLEHALVKAGVDAGQVESMKEDWHTYNVLDLAKPVVDTLLEEIDAKKNAQRDEATRAAGSPGTPRRLGQAEAHRLNLALDEAKAELTEAYDSVAKGERDLLPEKLGAWFTRLPAFDEQERRALED